MTWRLVIYDDLSPSDLDTLRRDVSLGVQVVQRWTGAGWRVLAPDEIGQPQTAEPLAVRPVKARSTHRSKLRP